MIVGLTETRMKVNEVVASDSVQKYDSMRDKKNQKGGGLIMLYLKKRVKMNYSRKKIKT